MKTGTSIRSTSLHSSLSAAFSQKTYFLWDFDGCFADTERLHYQAYFTAFAQVGHTLIEPEYYPSFTHLGQGTVREIEKYNLKVSPEHIMSLKKEIYWTLVNEQPVSLFPETAAIIDLLVAFGQGQGRIAIASNSPAHEIEVILKRSGYTGPLHALIGSTPSLQKKPAPDIFLHALRVLGGTSQNAVVFEDSERGLAAASAAQCASVWMRTEINKDLSTAVPYNAQCTHGELLGVLKGQL